MVAGDMLEFNYNGPSMNPTFRAGDKLLVTPCGLRKIAVGDVVVFRPDGYEKTITHRVIRLDARGVVTRGDNNNRVDPYFLQQHEIMGRVTTARRGKETLKVINGRPGLYYARLRWLVKVSNHTVSRILHPLYHGLADSGMFKHVLSPWARLRVIKFTKPHGVEYQLFLGSHFVGRRSPGAANWQIRRPFRLFIDKSRLPV